MSIRSALGAALGSLATVVVLASPASAVSPLPDTVPVAHKTRLPTEQGSAPQRVAPAVSKADAAADNGNPPLSGGGRGSVLWILGGVVGWAGVIVLRGVRRPADARA